MNGFKLTIILVFALLAAACISGISQKPNAIPIATVEPPLANAKAQVGENSAFSPQNDSTGKLLYCYSTAVYGKQGFTWPWSLYFVVKQFSADTKDDVDVKSYKVDTRYHDFILQPQFAPDGAQLSFKIGSYASLYDTFSVYIYNIKTQALEMVDAPYQSVWYLPVLWSPNSHYLAYFRGGFSYPGPSGFQPLELWVYDILSHKSRFVVRHEDLFHNIAWTTDNQLLYSLFPGAIEMRNGTLASLFRFDPKGENAATHLLDDAIYPTPSPDGKWVAAFSTGSATNVTGNSKRALMLLPTDNGESMIVNDKIDFHYTSLLWSPDNRHLYRINKSLNNKIITVRIFDYSLATKAETFVVSFDYINYGRETDEVEPAFRPLKVSHDGRYLFFALIQESIYKTTARSVPSTYLKAIKFDTKSIIQLFSVPGISGVDWLDESSPLK